MKKRLILGLVGTLGAGKSSAVEYLTSKGYDYVKLSDVIREKANKESLTRDELQDFGDGFRKKEGEDILAKEAWKKIARSKASGLLVDGIRNVAEVTFLKKQDNFFLISIDKHPRSRFKRLRIRGSERDPKTWEEFKKMEQRDQDEHTSFGQQTRKVMEMADFSIKNDSPVEFYLELEKLIKELSK